ncbi:phosphatase 2C-like domain-containing protein [Parasitella parasitica]|nr:phosphatase 2C-like domain-containing protein [Parasitella parasitica]
MGQTLSEPNIEKITTFEAGSKYFYGCSQMQGWRLTMEDAHTTLLKLRDTDASFFGVFDGHGGSTIAQYTGQKLHEKVAENKHFESKEYGKALKEAFLELDNCLTNDPNFAYDPSGCTAVVALLTDDNHIFVANAGDSRCIISINGVAKPLSEDHKPTGNVEMERITKAGGFVEFGRVNGNLALSRAIGDFEFKQNEQLPPEKQAVTCDPDITDREITNNDEFLVLACDGIWDCMSNQDVVDYVRSKIAEDKTLKEICESIMDNCLADDQTTNGLGYDNMSVIIVAILNGRTEEEWYQWMKKKATDNSSYKTASTNVTDATNINNIPDSTPSKLTPPGPPTTTTATTTSPPKE